uniref:Renalase, FAD-dependent amine oxidase n=1 Tax=Eptatretus burgeri TaxID=7764 RepID=A0A8C4X009_EPTBU
MGRVLVLGAGLTGALCCAMLRSPSLQVTVWEKEREAGGRMSNTHWESQIADLGAQYITRMPGTRQAHQGYYTELLEAGVLKPLEGLVEGMKNMELGTKHFVAPRGSSSIVNYFLEQSDANVKFGCHVTHVLLRDGELEVWTQNGAHDYFDTVILSVPTPQILLLQGDLAKSIPTQRSALQKVRYSSRFALVLFYNAGQELGVPWVMKYVTDSPIICFLSLDNRKRSCEPLGEAPVLVVHSSVHFGAEQSQCDVEEVAQLIQCELQRLLPHLPSHVHHKVHRWCHSQVTVPVDGSPGHLILHQRPLIACVGDYFTRSNFDGCIESALSLTSTLKSLL